ncbi:GspE/PulE family protein [Polymorphobacter sp.]|uniref:GspE/PulE family protein n=1 Tax=Polymorphobacter sp. TaxID=1909290 RepID=UPI003F720C65
MTDLRLPYGFARRYGVVVTGAVAGGLGVALREGEPPVAALAEVRRIAGRPLHVERVAAARFDRMLADHYAGDGVAAAAAMGEADGLGSLVDGIPTAEDLLDSADEAPVIRLINGLIAEAAREGVSDIHIEPYETALVVRMRVDGQLRERHRLPASVAATVVSRVKVMARLDIAERRLPQDGRIGLALAGKSLDVRVSTLPSRAGERVVLRLLDKDNAGIGLEALGMPPAIEADLRAALAEPNGMVLVTGPTGSGKTTSLYAGLRLLNDGSRNILTVEDPVEYAVDGVGQTQVNARVGLSFAAGLRAILRQDPDVVMVGEIRDSETAEIAVQAALTGHLVLSSVHTNDAAGAITRLRDFGVEPFLIASVLRAVVAQRLVRRLCDDCAEWHPLDAARAAMVGLPEGTRARRPRGCDACAGSGWRGRIGVFEAVRVGDRVRRLIMDGGDEAAIAAIAFRKNPDLAAAARTMVRDGITTAEEAARVMRAGEGPADG